MKNIIGVMSGTSLDGLDLALCQISQSNDTFSYEIIKAETLPYPNSLSTRLKNIAKGSALEFNKLDTEYGVFIGNKINTFLADNALEIDAIASHGHTIFHQPNLGFTTQIGNGASIAATTGITTICDFRSLDVALKGQGAPLVPMGDKLLFSSANACLNLGGIANISFDDAEGKRKAFDVCICNMALNFFANKKGLEFDTDGNLAKSGNIHPSLLKDLSNLSYYQIKGSKSLGFEWFESVFLEIISTYSIVPLEDFLATLTEHMAIQIAESINTNQLKSILITGGGAFNKHLVALIKLKTSAEIILPDNKLINFKEALIFAFLGFLRLTEQTNTLHSVTGATQNSIGGAIYVMNRK